MSTELKLLQCFICDMSQKTHTVNQMSEFVHHQTVQACSFLKSMYTKNERIAQIDAYHQQLGSLVMSFQACLLHTYLSQKLIVGTDFSAT